MTSDPGVRERIFTAEPQKMLMPKPSEKTNAAVGFLTGAHPNQRRCFSFQAHTTGWKSYFFAPAGAAAVVFWKL
jgi:hypothetical protein